VRYLVCLVANTLFIGLFAFYSSRILIQFHFLLFLSLMSLGIPGSDPDSDPRSDPDISDSIISIMTDMTIFNATSVEFYKL